VSFGQTLGQTFGPGACSLIPNSRTCVDATPCKTDSTGVTVCLAGTTVPSGGVRIPQSCWQYSYQYACATSTEDSCTPYENNIACSVISSSCQDFAQPSGTCDSWNYTYQCQTQAAQTTQQMVCSNGLFNTNLFPTPTNTNNTFTQAAIAQEILREAQVYSKDGTEIFSGVHETCRKGYAGIQNCCKSLPGAKSNSVVADIALGATGSVVKYAGEVAVDRASEWMFDAMYNNGLWTDAMTSMLSTGSDTLGTSLASSGFSVGAYGFSYSTVNTTGAGLANGDTMLLGSSDTGFLMFNPYVLVAALVIAYLQSLSACSQEEQMLGMHKGASLSVYETEACTSSFLGACLGYTDSYCSFNSVLAKIINTQGKAQLGLNPADCTGFTLAQLAQLNFSTMDFSEFAASLTQQALASVPTSPTINQAYTPIMQGAPAGSAQIGTMATGSNVVGGTTPAAAPPANSNLPTYP
jgi:conjugal transfer mating pair stabilization protein TraN